METPGSALNNSGTCQTELKETPSSTLNPRTISQAKSKTAMRAEMQTQRERRKSNKYLLIVNPTTATTSQPKFSQRSTNKNKGDYIDHYINVL